ncbi:lycopene cyclase domain-containing protein [Salinarchaeum sp. IM2453]|uniref:lycopene cyclase domain-containing protein n=1 Tax=Salinarchaeum sp. IM2453 TaxID=2862870 RepID=UPI0037C76572
MLTYLQFHLVFTLPVLAILWYLAPSYNSVRRRRAALGLVILNVIAFTYTTPWVSYMIQTGVWWYGESAVAWRGLYIPLGEYMFFTIQVLIVGFYLHWRGFDYTYQSGDLSLRSAAVGVVIGVGMVIGGLYLITLDDSFLYLGGLIAWVGPIIIIQWIAGGGYLLRKYRPWVEATLVPSLYLIIVDRIAIGMGTWVISDQYTSELSVPLLGLPIEEGLFFFLASLMTVTGLVLWEWILDYNDQTDVFNRIIPDIGNSLE